MRKKSDFILRLCLIVGDALALLLSFAAAYYIRVRIDPRPYTFETQFGDYVVTVMWLVPIMLIILALLGLYRKSIVINKSRLPERGRLLIAAVMAVAALIVFDFFTGKNIFPVRVMAVTAMALSFVFLLAERKYGVFGGIHFLKSGVTISLGGGCGRTEVYSGGFA